jgi:glycosyltransferase involved in cell wall biosynthesis
MRILQILASVDPKFGGPSKSAVELGQSLAAKGHEVTRFTTNYGVDGSLNVPTDCVVLQHGVSVRFFPVDWPKNYRVSWRFAQALARDIPKYDVVQIHGLYLFTTLAGAFFGRKYQVPYVITLHGMLDPFLRRKSRIKKAVYTLLFEKRNLDNAAAIHCTSQEELELVGPVGIKAPAVVVPWGLDSKEYATLPDADLFRSRYPCLRDKQIILFLGRINFKKGLDLLTQAFGELARRRKDVHLVLAGPDNEGYGKRVRQWLAQEGVVEHVTFTGMLQGEDKLAAFAASDVFVLSSYAENFGMAVVEAMACGLPVIISNKVNIWREIADAQAGIVVNCGVLELTEALLKALDDPISRKRWGENGKRLIEQKFTWTSVAEQMTQVYQSALKHAL